MPPDPPQPARPTPLKEDRLRVQHKLKCAADAQTVVGGSEAQDIASDRLRARSLVNCFTETGEAAARLSLAARSRIGALPWRRIVGMRNIIVHVYWGIDFNEPVKTTRDGLPTLVNQLSDALAAWPADS